MKILVFLFLAIGVISRFDCRPVNVTDLEWKSIQKRDSGDFGNSAMGSAQKEEEKLHTQRSAQETYLRRLAKQAAVAPMAQAIIMAFVFFILFGIFYYCCGEIFGKVEFIDCELGGRCDKNRVENWASQPSFNI